MKFATSLSIGVVAILAASSTAVAAPSSPSSEQLQKRQSGSGYFSPYTNGGSMLTGGTASGLGEPINVIVSGESDAGVLSQAGFEEFSRAFYFSPGSCLGITQGTPQTANLGDGHGALAQTNLMRWNFKQGDGGTCLQSLNGGNHFRYWVQNGTAANSGAIFIAASVEQNATLNHMIDTDGYDQGRDQLVGNVTAGTLTSPGGFQYTVTSQSNTDLLSSVSTSQINHGIAIDGSVSILTVRVTKQGTIGADSNTSTSSSSSGGSTSTSQQSSAISHLLTGSDGARRTVALVAGATALSMAVSLVL
ncbi:hypothetical protein BCV70DRAFT_197228 [Testicularia cyperi]|uniref:Concanavalin A-like lectin/glucanase n=1 Tax=Testicularia cyperi TaxID=1882483 RepID=A0A317Y0C0_9BASI|nr:hypothetical protein BCV70DRAFT_197228 [Testicularia cyperi]